MIAIKSPPLILFGSLLVFQFRPSFRKRRARIIAGTLCFVEQKTWIFSVSPYDKKPVNVVAPKRQKLLTGWQTDWQILTDLLGMLQIPKAERHVLV